jgi:peroxiredoxin Q/BCP
MPQSTPAVGQTAPDFTLPANTGQNVRLSDLYKDHRVVLYFYPKADTPGCTKEACGFSDTADEYQSADTVILGISPDPLKDVQKFHDKFHLSFPLLADADHAVTEKYGQWVEKSMYGKKYWGAARTTFVIEKGGKIAQVFEKVKPEGHEREVLAFLKNNLIRQPTPFA